MCVVRALVIVSREPIRRAFVRNQVGLLRKVAVEDGPAAVAAFVQVIALEKELDRQLVKLPSILDLKPRLDRRNKTGRMARPAATLLCDFTGQVDVIDQAL